VGETVREVVIVIASVVIFLWVLSYADKQSDADEAERREDESEDL
jgi:hypothetical protein